MKTNRSVAGAIVGVPPSPFGSGAWLLLRACVRGAGLGLPELLACLKTDDGTNSKITRQPKFTNLFWNSNSFTRNYQCMILQSQTEITIYFNICLHCFGSFTSSEILGSELFFAYVA